MERKEFRLNEVIFKDGIYQNWMYSISEGSVDIYSGYGTSSEKKLITLTKGQFFGEIGMIALMPRTATAVAAEENVVLEQISHEDFEDYLMNHAENIQPIMSSVSRRIRELTDDLSMITKLTNEALDKEEGEKATTNGLTEFIGGLLGKLKSKNSSNDESSIMKMRQQALSSEMPSTIQLEKGNVIFRAGEQADCLYDIYDGVVGIYSDYQTPNEKLLAELRVDEVFGEMGILDNMPRSATAVCLTDCTVLVVKPENFMMFFEKKPALILQLLQRMCVQVRDLTEKYLKVCKTLEEMGSLEDNDQVVKQLKNICNE
jgi:CRP-like cAMP-binding protein